MFDVMGFEGYELHFDVSEVDDAIQHSFLHSKSVDSNSGSRGDARKKALDNEAEKQGAEKSLEQEMALPEVTTNVEASQNGEIPGVSVGPETATSSTTEGAGSSVGPVEQQTTQSSGDENGDKNCKAETTENAAAAIQCSDDEDGVNPLVKLRKKANMYTRKQVLSAVRTHGIELASKSARDIPTYYCLHLLAMLETGRVSKESEALVTFPANPEWPVVRPKGARHGTPLISPLLSEGRSESQNEVAKDSCLQTNLLISKECLLRCLAISNQGTSVGMIGWLEYGAANSFGRMAQAPFFALRELAFTCACEGDWDGAVDVLGALTVRCDQQLPLYHPLSLSSFIDLAGAASMASDLVLERKALGIVSTRLAFYLAEQEKSFFAKYDSTSREGGGVVLRFENGIDGISMLKGFVEKFENQLDRSFLELVGKDGNGKAKDILCINHCFLADALSALANCVRAGEALFGLPTDGKTGSQYYWHAAYVHYETALKGFVRNKKGLTDDTTVSVAYGIGRCLRELGQRQKAVQVLSSVVSALGQRETECNRVEALDHAEARAPSDGHQTPVSLSFLPNNGVDARSILLSKNIEGSGRCEQFMALCLWLMAVFTVEDDPNERGRMRALSLLHAASEALQTVMTSSMPNQAASTSAGTHMFSDTPLSYRQTCRELYLRIEEEAKELLAPLQDAAAAANPRAPPRDDVSV